MWTKTLKNWLLNAEIFYTMYTCILNNEWDSNFWTLNFRCFVLWTANKLTNALVINSVTDICIFQVSILVSKDFSRLFHTYDHFKGFWRPWKFVHQIPGLSILFQDLYEPCKKDGGHAIRSAVSENPTLHTHFTAVFATDVELLTMEFLKCAEADLSRHAGIRCMNTCCGPCAVLWAWAWSDDLHINFTLIALYTGCANMNFPQMPAEHHSPVAACSNMKLKSNKGVLYRAEIIANMSTWSQMVNMWRKYQH